jgi:A/G-specific adenine glycosylase
MLPDYVYEYVPAMNSSIQQALLNHYDRERRKLPWRDEPDPYRVLVSEVMLQQTRVQTVLSYYGGWLERFPDIDTLADADIDDVLKAWEGLGYYRRARNLHRAARLIRERPGGDVPDTYEALRALPGVGEYTAGAVASIAFGAPVPAVDGNVRRVLARLFNEPEPRTSWLREKAAELMDLERPGDWNQALMELGATLCSPRAPECAVCPVVDCCAAYDASTQGRCPGTSVRTKPKKRRIALAVLQADGCVMLERRPSEGLLAGMWSFPEVAGYDTGPSMGEAAKCSRESVLAAVPEWGLVATGCPQALPSVEHRFTHLHAIYEPWLVPVAARSEGEGRVWVDPATSNDVAVPAAQQKVLALVNEMETA